MGDKYAALKFQYELDSRLTDTPSGWWEYWSDSTEKWITVRGTPAWSRTCHYRRKADAPPQWRSVELDPPPENELVLVCDEGDPSSTDCAIGGIADSWDYWMPANLPAPPRAKKKPEIKTLEQRVRDLERKLEGMGNG